MNLNVLRYVEAIAEEQNFTKAAMRLYIAQPSLSQAIRALEKELGAELFDRSGRAVTLTPSGERYLRWAKTVLRSEQKLKTELKSAPGGLRKLVIGASPYRCKALFPAVMRDFYERYPACRIELFDQYQNEALPLLEEGKIDFLVDLPPAGGYPRLHVAEERILVAAPKSFHLPLKKGGRFQEVELEDLLVHPVILIDEVLYASPLHLGPFIRHLYDEVDAVPDVAVQCCGAETAHMLAAQGLGFTVISELFMQANPMPGVDYCEIAGHSLSREVCAIASPDRSFSQDSLAFIDLLRERSAGIKLGS